MSALCRHCCKSPKLSGDNFLAVRRFDRRPPIYVVSITLPRSPVSLSSGDEVPPHLYTKVSPKARRIFDHQCKKIFATISATSGLMHRSKRHLHSITSSERACRLGGISKPSVRKAGRTCEPQKSRHVSRRSARKRLVESDRQLTYADADRLVESVGAPSPPSNRANRRLRSARIACPPARGSTNRTKGMYVVQKTITKAIFFTGARNVSTANV